MAFIGMDVEAVRTLAGQLNSKADEIDTITSTLTSQLSTTQWEGTDAGTFRANWTSTHVTQLMTVANALRDAATNAIRNADEQSTASSA
ncbi:hypothetical protein [Actinophytocola sp.]|uniref:WXG100 family type VII secretion target n=1 Tax=Actinophytocola sp. TaxID=1872138 RepID=UPI002ED4227D